jgi:hypothetical protein
VAPHRFHGQVNAAPRGHHHQREVLVEQANLRNQFQTFAARSRVAGVIQIHEHDIELARLERLQHPCWMVRSFRAVAVALEQQLKSVQNVWLIVRNQDASRDCALGRDTLRWICGGAL